VNLKTATRDLGHGIAHACTSQVLGALGSARHFDVGAGRLLPGRRPESRCWSRRSRGVAASA